MFDFEVCFICFSLKLQSVDFFLDVEQGGGVDDSSWVSTSVSAVVNSGCRNQVPSAENSELLMIHYCKPGVGQIIALPAASNSPVQSSAVLIHSGDFFPSPL